MGLSIGAIGRTVTTPTRPNQSADPSAIRQRADQASNNPVAPRNPSEQGGPSTTNPQAAGEPSVPRTGFGRDSLSLPRAALEALGGGVRTARETVPTLTEQRESIQQRIAGIQELQSNPPQDEPENTTGPAEEQAEAIAPRDTAARGTNASSSTTDSQAAQTAPTVDRTPPAPSPAGNESVNGTVFTFGRNDNTPAPRLIDIRV